MHAHTNSKYYREHSDKVVADTVERAAVPCCTENRKTPHHNLTLKVLVTTIDAQWEGWGM